MPVQHDQTLQGDARLHPAFTETHQNLDSDDVDYICCPLEFDNEIDHLSHMITHIAENIILLQRIKCDYCNYSFNDYNELKRHLPKHLGFHCYYCQQHIPKWWQLVQHVMYQHNYRIKHESKPNLNNKRKKFKRRATKAYIKNKKRIKTAFKTKNKKDDLVPIIKTEPGNYTDLVLTCKTEPSVKSEPIFGANVKSEPIFDPNIIKTEPFDYY